MFEHYDPATMVQLRREMERLLGSYGGELGIPAGTRPRGYPAANLWQDGERVFVEAEIPGIEPEDLDIHVLEDDLMISGRRKPLEGRNLTYHRQELATGEFARHIQLPVEVEADRVEATAKDGVLTIVLEKAETAKPRKVSVKAK